MTGNQSSSDRKLRVRQSVKLERIVEGRDDSLLSEENLDDESSRVVMDQLGELDVVISPLNRESAEEIQATLRFEAIDESSKAFVPVQVRDIEIVQETDGAELWATLRIQDQEAKVRHKVAAFLKDCGRRAVTRGELEPSILGDEEVEDEAIDMMIEQLAFCRPGRYKLSAIWLGEDSEQRTNSLDLKVNVSDRLVEMPPSLFPYVALSWKQIYVLALRLFIVALAMIGGFTAFYLLYSRLTGQANHLQ